MMYKKGYEEESIMVRVIFKYTHRNTYLIADAYPGINIKKATIDFLGSAGGNQKIVQKFDKETIGLYGSADLVTYMGHNGLMDFKIEKVVPTKTKSHRKAIVLACKSQSYFNETLEKLACESMLLTNGFMAPEAYTLEATIHSWINGEDNALIKESAAHAYQKYQKEISGKFQGTDPLTFDNLLYYDFLCKSLISPKFSTEFNQLPQNKHSTQIDKKYLLLYLPRLKQTPSSTSYTCSICRWRS